MIPIHPKGVGIGIYRVFKKLDPPSRAETWNALANSNISPCSTTKTKWIDQISDAEKKKTCKFLAN